MKGSSPAAGQQSPKGPIVKSALGIEIRKPISWEDVAQWSRFRLPQKSVVTQQRLTVGEKISNFLEDSITGLQNVIRRNPVTSKPEYEYANNVMAINRRYGQAQGWSNEDEDLDKYFAENEVNLDFYSRASKALGSKRFGVHHHPFEVAQAVLKERRNYGKDNIGTKRTVFEPVEEMFPYKSAADIEMEDYLNDTYVAGRHHNFLGGFRIFALKHLPETHKAVYPSPHDVPVFFETGFEELAAQRAVEKEQKHSHMVKLAKRSIVRLRRPLTYFEPTSDDPDSRACTPAQTAQQSLATSYNNKGVDAGSSHVTGERSRQRRDTETIQMRTLVALEHGSVDSFQGSAGHLNQPEGGSLVSSVSFPDGGFKALGAPSVDNGDDTGSGFSAPMLVNRGRSNSRDRTAAAAAALSGGGSLGGDGSVIAATSSKSSLSYITPPPPLRQQQQQLQQVPPPQQQNLHIAMIRRMRRQEKKAAGNTAAADAVQSAAADRTSRKQSESQSQLQGLKNGGGGNRNNSFVGGRFSATGGSTGEATGAVDHQEAVGEIQDAAQGAQTYTTLGNNDVKKPYGETVVDFATKRIPQPGFVATYPTMTTSLQQQEEDEFVDSPVVIKPEKKKLHRYQLARGDDLRVRVKKPLFAGRMQIRNYDGKTGSLNMTLEAQKNLLPRELLEEEEEEDRMQMLNCGQPCTKCGKHLQPSFVEDEEDGGNDDYNDDNDDDDDNKEDGKSTSGSTSALTLLSKSSGKKTYVDNEYKSLKLSIPQKQALRRRKQHAKMKLFKSYLHADKYCKCANYAVGDDDLLWKNNINLRGYTSGVCINTPHLYDDVDVSRRLKSTRDYVEGGGGRGSETTAENLHTTGGGAPYAPGGAAAGGSHGSHAQAGGGVEMSPLYDGVNIGRHAGYPTQQQRHKDVKEESRSNPSLHGEVNTTYSAYIPQPKSYLEEGILDYPRGTGPGYGPGYKGSVGERGQSPEVMRWDYGDTRQGYLARMLHLDQPEACRVRLRSKVKTSMNIASRKTERTQKLVRTDIESGRYRVKYERVIDRDKEDEL